MRKSINIRKAALTTILTAAMAATLGACGNTTEPVASEDVVVVVTDKVEVADADDAAEEALADRGEAASRSLGERAPIVKTAAQVLSAESLAAQVEAADLDHYRIANLDVENGRLETDDLCKLSWTNKSIIRCDAANAAEHLNEAFKAEFGTDLEINDSYRSYEKQVSVRKELGKIAAVPGYSNHGLGVALDFGSNIPDGSSEEYQWMAEHAGDFGWHNPEHLVEQKGEYWHWEFTGFDA